MPCEMDLFFFLNGGVNEMLTPTFMSEWSEIRDSAWKGNNIYYLGATWGKYSIFLKVKLKKNIKKKLKIKI